MKSCAETSRTPGMLASCMRSEPSQRGAQRARIEQAHAEVQPRLHDLAPVFRVRRDAAARRQRRARAD